jgi:hypothetical protein
MVSTITRGMLIGVLVLIAAAGRCGPGDPPVPHGDSGPTAAGSAVAGSDTALARDALERYWEHLSAGEWDDAAGLFGGDWRETAAHWVEPEVADTLSTAGFLARMCGGMLVCDLTLRGSCARRSGRGAPSSWRSSSPGPMEAASSWVPAAARRGRRPRRSPTTSSARVASSG